MLLDDLLEVARRDMPIPHALGIHDDDGALVMLLIAAHAGCAHSAKTPLFDDVTELPEEAFTSKFSTPVPADSGADEHVQFPAGLGGNVIHGEGLLYAAVTLYPSMDS